MKRDSSSLSAFVARRKKADEPKAPVQVTPAPAPAPAKPAAPKATKPASVAAKKNPLVAFALEFSGRVSVPARTGAKEKRAEQKSYRAADLFRGLVR